MGEDDFKVKDNIDEAIKRKDLLVIDDNEDMIHLYKRILTKQGYNVRSADNGYDGLRQAFQDVPDLVLLDLSMPKMDGYQVCKRLKESEETKMVPVIIVTCKADMNDKIQGLETGADDYLTKPVNNAELLARVKSLLKIRELNDRLIEAQKLETLRQTAVSVCHEINNPLCSISANAEILKTAVSGTDKKLVRKIDIIIKEVDRINRVVDKLMRATKVVSTEYIPGIEMLDLDESVE